MVRLRIMYPVFSVRREQSRQAEAQGGAVAMRILINDG